MPTHLDPISSEEEELQVPVFSVLITSALPSPPASGPALVSPPTLSQHAPPPTDAAPSDEVHIAPLFPLMASPSFTQSGEFPAATQVLVLIPMLLQP